MGAAWCTICGLWWDLSGDEDEEMNDKILDELFKTLEDIETNATDVYWISDYETVWERICGIYLENGGDRDRLKARFPDYM